MNDRLRPELSRGEKCIYIMYMSSLANVLSPLARHLKAAGFESVLICYSRNTLPSSDVYDFDTSVFAEIVELDPILRADPFVGIERSQKISDAAAQIEQRYGFSITEIIRTDRLVGIGWVTSVTFPELEYGRSTSYPQAVDVAVRLVAMYEALIKRRPPAAMVGLASGLGPAMLWTLIKAIGVETRTLVMGRSGPAAFWADDTSMHPLGFAKAYEESLQSDTVVTIRKDEKSSWLPTSVRAQNVLDSMRGKVTWASLIRQIQSATRKAAGDRLYRRDQAYGKYLFVQQLQLILKRHFWQRRILREKPTMEVLPEGLPFVFFPLQIEPEGTLMMELPMCDNHLTAVDWLAKTVPGGWYVVVKEHPGATVPRVRAFWTVLKKYPNVVVAKTLEDARGIVERSRAVAVLNGSLGLQAATIGKPVITFHPKYIGRYMPHVLFAESYRSTREALETIRDDRLPSMSERLSAASAFQQALKKCEFSVSDPQILSGVAMPCPIAIADVEAIVGSLLVSLNPAAFRP